MADGQALVGVAANLDVSFLDQDGDLVAAVGTVTVDVARADGTAIATGASTTNPSTGVYRYALSAANNTLLDLLTLTWKDGGTTRAATVHEIVGGYYFSVADLRAFDTTLTDSDKYSNADLRQARDETEHEFEDITGCAWVPRYLRYRCSGTGSPQLILPVWAPRSVRTVRVYSDATSYTAFTADELAAINTDDTGIATRTDGSAWPHGCENLVLEVEHGYSRPTPDLLHAAKQRSRYRLNMERSRNREQAVRVTVDGATYEMADDDDIEQRQVMRVVRRHEVTFQTFGIA